MSEFPVPKAKSLKRKSEGILEEDLFLNKLEKIIKRDFFPELVKIEEFKKMQAIFLNSNLLKKDPNLEDESEEEENFQLKGMSLNSFLEKNNSQDNVEFSEIMKQKEQEWKEKHKYIYEREIISKQNLLAIEQSTGNKLQNMLEGNKNNNMLTNEYQCLSSLFFPIETPKSIEQSKEVQIYKQQDNINFQNTRIQQNDFFKNEELMKKKLNNIHDYGSFGGVQTPDLMGLKRKTEGSKSNVLYINGYNLITIPNQPNDQPATKSLYSFPKQDQREQIVDRQLKFLIKNKQTAKTNSQTQMLQLLTGTPQRKASQLIIQQSSNLRMDKNTSVKIQKQNTEKRTTNITDGLLKL